MDNLFQFVKTLTLADDEARKRGFELARENGKKLYHETRRKLRELQIKSGEIICLDYKPTNETINPDDESDLVEPINPDDVGDADCNSKEHN
jgi:hypothetical protein